MYQEELYYKCEKAQDGSILSVDNLRISFDVHPRNLQNIADFFNNSTRIDIEKYPQNFKMGSYRHLWTIRYSPTASMTVGLEFNGKSAIEDRLKGYLDFNPNKVGKFSQFWRDYDTIHQWSIFEIKRCDIAYDVPVKREQLRLIKDRRKYRIDSKSISDFTEYIGERNKTGFVKVYNKQVEADLDVPLTRIELTCKFDEIDYLSHFPLIYKINENGQQISFEDAKLNDYEQTILTLALDLLGLRGDPFQALQLLRSVKRKKLIEYLPVEPLPLPDCTCVHQLITSYGGVLQL